MRLSGHVMRLSYILVNHYYESVVFIENDIDRDYFIIEGLFLNIQTYN